VVTEWLLILQRQSHSLLHAAWARESSHFLLKGLTASVIVIGVHSKDLYRLAIRESIMCRSKLYSRCLVFCLCLSASVRFAAGQKQEFSNRFEGSYQNQANTDLDVIGVLRSSISFNSPSTLSVKFFLPATGLATDKVLVEAQEITQSQNYFMQSKSFPVRSADWNVFTPWPSRDVIDPFRVVPQNLAVTVSYVDQSGTRVYLPADVNTGVAHPQNTYTVQFRTAWSIHSLDEKLTASDGTSIPLPTIACSAEATCVLYDAGTSHALSLDMAGHSDGFYSLQLTGHVPNKFDPVHVTVTFYHRRV
jgi:hypothetical protein